MSLMHASNVDDMEKGVDELGFSAPHRDVNWNELAFSMHPKKAEFERLGLPPLNEPVIAILGQEFLFCKI